MTDAPPTPDDLDRPLLVRTADDRPLAVRGRPGAAGDHGPTILFCGGFRSDMTGSKAVALLEHAARRDLGFVRFDYRGHGRSPGRFEDLALSDWLADALAVIDQATRGPVLLVGSSMGGWIASLAAEARAQRIAALVTVAAAPDFTRDLMEPGFTEAQRREMAAQGHIRMASAYDPAGYVITRRLIEDGRQLCLAGRTLGWSGPARLLHGSADAEVPWRLSAQLLAQLPHPDTRLILLKDGDHRLSDTRGLAALLEAVDAMADAVRR